MRLHLGYQNLIGESDSVAGGDTNTVQTSSLNTYGTTLAPDGSSLAEGFYYSSPWGSVVTSAARTDLDSGEHIYMFGTFVKPTSGDPTRHILFAQGDTDAESFSYNIYFEDGSVLSAVENSGSFYDSCLDYGYYSLRDNWIYAYISCDFRNKTVTTLRFLNYVNAPYAGSDPSEGVYVWGFTLEKTQERRLNGPPIITGVTPINPSDFVVVDFTQLPSNIDEVENNIYEVTQTLGGSVNNSSTHIDRNLKKLVWDKINYVTHGKMIYNMRESLRDKVEQDCVLFYPEGFKNEIDYSFIRVIDFNFEYTEIRDIAHVELDYYIISSHRY